MQQKLRQMRGRTFTFLIGVDLAVIAMIVIEGRLYRTKKKT